MKKVLEYTHTYTYINKLNRTFLKEHLMHWTSLSIYIYEKCIKTMSANGSIGKPLSSEVKKNLVYAVIHSLSLSLSHTHTPETLNPH